MRDLVLVASLIAFFAVTVAYVRACEWIIGPDSAADRNGAAESDEERAEARP